MTVAQDRYRVARAATSLLFLLLSACAGGVPNGGLRLNLGGDQTYMRDPGMSVSGEFDALLRRHVPISSRPSTRSASGKRIEISIAHQQLTAWEGTRIVMRFPISTGRPGYRTPAGRFKILAKTRLGWSRPWAVYMPWMMPFYGNYSIHELPHYRGGPPIGASQLGRPASHGCVRVGLRNAVQLYRWTPIRTPVWIH